MSRFKSKRPSGAMIVAIIALVAAMAGGAYAQGSLPKNSVGTKQLKPKAVKENQINNKAVTTKKLDKQAVAPNKIEKEAVKTNKVAPAAVTNSKLAHPIYWAYVTDGAGLSRSEGATTAASIGTGHREVTFETDVSECVYVATATYQGGTGRIANAALDTTDPTKVRVRIRNGGSGAASTSERAFSLAVHC